MSRIQFEDAGQGNDNSLRPVNSEVSKPTRRQRWATRRLGNSSGLKKRVSIVDRLHKRNASSAEEKRNSAGSSTGDGNDGANNEGAGAGGQQETRRIFFNMPIPDEERDEEGALKAQYPGNKIRTAKYTPLTFIPKNLWLQFQNIANLYFLFIIILGFFPIFGVTNPGLNAVPLIVIIIVTAIKDAIEDWRRTVQDNQLNNSPVYRLVDWVNVNVSEEHVSLWRRFKKACTRFIINTYRAMQRNKKVEEDSADEDDRRFSMATYRQSIYSQRQSYYGNGEDGIQMTPVASPHPDPQIEGNGWPDAPNDGDQHLQAAKAVRDSVAPGGKRAGTILDRSKQTPHTARFKREYWKSVKVGDFVRLYNGDQIPADIVILSSSDPDGACNIETKSLDGETNLKVRQALNCGRLVKHARDCERTEFFIESEPPHQNLHNYSAAIRWRQRDENDPNGPLKDKVEPIGINNLLLRGCSLQNTEWVLGVVVFTGPETKIMLNTGETPTKRPALARQMNFQVIPNFTILFILCLVTGIVNGVSWASQGSWTFFEYGSYGGSPPVEGIVAFFAGLILFQNFVPISLYITLEIIRSVQALFIFFDLDMVYERLGMGCVPRSWNISDDVGQIEYIFSDKTGTLTQNVMEFKKCSINGVKYGEAYTEAQFGMQRREGIDAEAVAARAQQAIAEGKVRSLELLRKIHDNPYLIDDNLTFISPEFATDLAGQSNNASQKQAIESFMIALALCHTVITEHTPGDPPQIEFKAQSPDEAALVATARDCGFTVLGRNGDDLIVNVLGEERAYTVLNLLEFNSTRKRMSAIIRMPDGTIRLFCKGADSIIYKRLARGQQQALRKTTADHLEEFAREGLRTLCIAERVLGEEEYQVWNESHDLAAAALVNRDDKLEEVANAIEQELMLLGGTAIEDRLQDGVPDTISLLANAGIKLWVLTGDKVETAINIGFSCNLLNNDMELIVFNVPADKPEAAAAELQRYLDKFGIQGTDEELIAARKDHTPPAATHALIIDGDTLKLMLEEDLKQKFLLLCKLCKSVLCCRVSPAQKAAVVQMVKNGLNIIALSVGDGANDVAMIQEADVGVGIAGEEGRQAVMSSDYAIGQFRFLQRLLLVHGRWSYRRLGEATANFFYKTLVWTFALFWYSIYNSFDGSYLFDYTYIILINLAFTSLPVIFMGIFDQDVSDKVSLEVPQLYMRGIERKEWSQRKFWLYMFDGLYQSLMCFFMPYLLYNQARFQRGDGLSLDDRQQFGILVASAAVISSNTYVLMNTYRWDWLTVLINAISSLLLYFWTGVYTSTTASAQFYNHAAEVYGTLAYWTVLFVTVVLCLLPRFAIKAFQKVFFPTDVDIVREQVTQGKYRRTPKNNNDAYVPPQVNAGGSPAGSDVSAVSSVVKPIEPQVSRDPRVLEDERPIYPPSIAPTNTTHNPRSQNGSNGTTFTADSFDFGTKHPAVNSWEQPEAGLTIHHGQNPSVTSTDFSSGGPLLRIESASGKPQTPHSPLRIPHDIHAV